MCPLVPAFSAIASNFSSTSFPKSSRMMKTTSSTFFGLAFTKSSTNHWTIGLPATGNIGLVIVKVCGRKRVPQPAIGIMIFILVLAFSRRTKSAFTARCFGQHLRFNNGDALVFCNDHLCNSIARFYRERFVRQIDERHFDLTAIIAVDGRRCIRQADSVLKRQPASWTQLRFIALRQLNK